MTDGKHVFGWQVKLGRLLLSGSAVRAQRDEPRLQNLGALDGIQEETAGNEHQICRQWPIAKS